MEFFFQKFLSKNVSDITSRVVYTNEFEGLLNDLSTQSIPLSGTVKKYPQLKWCLVNNSIYDLRDFDHPGGKYIIEQINGIFILRHYI